MNAKKLFDFGVDLSREIVRRNDIYGSEKVSENAVIPGEIAYDGPLDKDGRIPYLPSAEELMDEEAREDEYCGKPMTHKKSINHLLLDDDYGSENGGDSE